MSYGWESEEEKMKRWLRVPAAQKLAWLEEMRRFNAALPKSTLKRMLAQKRTRV
ncbi:MAG TPA: hypothetical protein P5110_01260 [Candidatus Omnitrophota bacterium]|nr:hypothetical protein [Candidatus Omnitrophota bacterium]HRZ14114.1 hypothetical protein [Candidatus Omnitrophota bacterium]